MSGRAVYALVALCVFAGAGCARPHIYTLGEVASPPRIASQVKISDAAKASGVVIVDCVIRKDGAVGDVKVVRHLDPRVDQATIEAIRQWRFIPAQRGGKPVAVHMLISTNFTP